MAAELPPPHLCLNALGVLAERRQDGLFPRALFEPNGSGAIRSRSQAGGGEEVLGAVII